MATKKFVLKPSYTLPLVACGIAFWDITPEDDPEYVFCSYRFAQTDPKHPHFDSYMENIKGAAQCVVDVLNKGLEHGG